MPTGRLITVWLVITRIDLVAQGRREDEQNRALTLPRASMPDDALKRQMSGSSRRCGSARRIKALQGADR